MSKSDSSQSDKHDDELPGMLAVAKGIAEQTFPHTMDAAVWAAEFVKLNPGADEGTMIGWFANAIMAGYDTAQARSASSAGVSIKAWSEMSPLERAAYNAGVEARSMTDEEVMRSQQQRIQQLEAQLATPSAREAIYYECEALARKKSVFTPAEDPDDNEYCRGYAKGREDAAEEIRMHATVGPTAKDGA